MAAKRYRNFVKAGETPQVKISNQGLSGEEAKRIYLEELSSAEHANPIKNKPLTPTVRKRKVQVEICSEKELFIAAQNDDFDTVRSFLDVHQEKLNTTDVFGWSLLMIACQANAINTVKVLLTKNADTSIRDKAGNSALSLVINNKNLALVDLFLNNEHTMKSQICFKHEKRKARQEFTCEICDNCTFDDGHQHLSSMVHNINANTNLKSLKHINEETIKSQKCFKGKKRKEKEESTFDDSHQHSSSTSHKIKASKDESAKHTMVSQKSFKRKKCRENEEYTCQTCDVTFDNSCQHLSSTVHNFNASKNLKPPPSYKIPVTNKGYQIMLKGGWDRTHGLGPDGSGNKYPIRAVQKLDKKGLGLEKVKKLKAEELVEVNRNKNKKMLQAQCHKQKIMEINFRREFY